MRTMTSFRARGLPTKAGMMLSILGALEAMDGTCLGLTKHPSGGCQRRTMKGETYCWQHRSG